MLATTSSEVSLLGCDFHAVTEEQALAAILGRCRSGDRATNIVITVNAAILVMMRRDPRLRSAVAAGDLVVADGTPLVWASRLLGAPLPGRVTGVDLMGRLLDAGQAQGLRVFLLGTTQERLDRLVEVVRERYPGIVVAGTRNGYFGPTQYAEVAAQVREARADLLLVGMPAPMKEIWCEQHREALATPVVLGVGGAFDVLAGYVRRAPVWMQNAGLEWLWRLILEPRKLWKRYLVTNSQFLALLAVASAKRVFRPSTRR